MLHGKILQKFTIKWCILVDFSIFFFKYWQVIFNPFMIYMTDFILTSMSKIYFPILSYIIYYPDLTKRPGCRRFLPMSDLLAYLLYLSIIQI